MEQKYTKEELISELHRFVYENRKTPRQRDMCENNGYIVYQQYLNIFGSWNAALIAAHLKLNKYKHTKEDTCIICGSSQVRDWCVNDNNDLICNRCYRHDRNFVKGVLDPNSKQAIGVITEYIVYQVLNDCIKCNNATTFHSKMDLQSNKYGDIDVKSSKCFKSTLNISFWNFIINKTLYTPNYYICLGFSEDKCKFEYVWIIPGNSEIISNTSIFISNSNLTRAKQYEVDPTPYNEVYQNLDIYSLPEFCNLQPDLGEVNG